MQHSKVECFHFPDCNPSLELTFVDMDNNRVFNLPAGQEQLEEGLEVMCHLSGGDCSEQQEQEQGGDGGCVQWLVDSELRYRSYDCSDNESQYNFCIRVQPRARSEPYSVQCTFGDINATISFFVHSKSKCMQLAKKKRA